MGFPAVRYRDEADSVRSICETLVHDLNGVNVWAAWVLVLYMLSRTRGFGGRARPRRNRHGRREANGMITFGRCEVTRRARMKIGLDASAAKRKLDDEEDDPEEMELRGLRRGRRAVGASVGTDGRARARDADRDGVEVLARRSHRRRPWSPPPPRSRICFAADCAVVRPRCSQVDVDLQNVHHAVEIGSCERPPPSRRLPSSRPGGLARAGGGDRPTASGRRRVPGLPITT